SPPRDEPARRAASASSARRTRGMMESESQPSPSARLRSREELADYLIEIGATLASYGCPSYRLEDVIREVAKDEGYEAHPFALPTGLFVRVRAPDGGDAQRMMRLFDWGVDLERLALVDEIFNDVAEKKTTIENAR